MALFLVRCLMTFQAVLAHLATAFVGAMCVWAFFHPQWLRFFDDVFGMEPNTFVRVLFAALVPIVLHGIYRRETGSRRNQLRHLATFRNMKRLKRRFDLPALFLMLFGVQGVSETTPIGQSIGSALPFDPIWLFVLGGSWFVLRLMLRVADGHRAVASGAARPPNVPLPSQDQIVAAANARRGRWIRSLLDDRRAH